MIKAKSKVFIVDDDLQVCNALKWLLESVNLNVDFFCNPLDFLNYCNNNSLTDCCVILDVRMPNISGLEVLEQLRLKEKSLPVIMITGHGDIPMAVRAMKAGAFDFLSKPFNDQRLLDKIQAALICSISNNQQQLVNLDNKERLATLTSRELDVMKLVVLGKLNKQIAGDLHLAVSTIELHRSRVMKKMGTKTLADLIKACQL